MISARNRLEGPKKDVEDQLASQAWTGAMAVRMDKCMDSNPRPQKEESIGLGDR